MLLTLLLLLPTTRAVLWIAEWKAKIPPMQTGSLTPFSSTIWRKP